MFFTVYKGHEIMNKGTGFKVINEDKKIQGEVFSSVKDAIEHIDSEISAKRESTLIVEIPFSGFYQTCHGEMFEIWLEHEEQRIIDEHNATNDQIEELRHLFHNDMNWPVLRHDYAQAYCDAFFKEVNDKLRSINLWAYSVTVDSPKEYNFKNDRILVKMDAEVMKPVVERLTTKDWRDFVAYRCQSVEGFVSFIPADFDKWDKDFTKWNASQLGLALEWFSSLIYDFHSFRWIFRSEGEILQDYDSSGQLSESIWNNSGEKFKSFLNAFFEA